MSRYALYKISPSDAPSNNDNNEQQFIRVYVENNNERLCQRAVRYYYYYTSYVHMSTTLVTISPVRRQAHLRPPLIISQIRRGSPILMELARWRSQRWVDLGGDDDAGGV